MLASARRAHYVVAVPRPAAGKHDTLYRLRRRRPARRSIAFAAGIDALEDPLQNAVDCHYVRAGGGVCVPAALNQQLQLHIITKTQSSGLCKSAIRGGGGGIQFVSRVDTLHANTLFGLGGLPAV